MTVFSIYQISDDGQDDEDDGRIIGNLPGNH